MSGILAVAATGEVATGTSAKTVLQIVAAANHRVKIKKWSISFKGVSNTAAPILVQLMRQTSAGTMSALTPKKVDPTADETLQTTAQHTSTAEPTTTDLADNPQLVHPQGGYVEVAPFGGDIIVPGGTRIGIVVTAAADVNCVAAITFEE